MRFLLFSLRVRKCFFRTGALFTQTISEIAHQDPSGCHRAAPKCETSERNRAPQPLELPKPKRVVQSISSPKKECRRTERDHRL